MIEKKLRAEYPNFISSPYDSLQKNLGVKILTPYENISTYALNFSTRVQNCFKCANIKTLADLLQYSPQNLINLRNLGKDSVKNIFFTLKEFFDNDLPTKKFNPLNLRDTHIDAIIVALENFSASVKNKYRILDGIIPQIRELPAQIKNKNLRLFIETYNSSYNPPLKIPSLELTIAEFAVYLMNHFDEYDAPNLKNFIDWLNFDLKSFIKILFATIFRKEVELTVILERANGKTLADIGKILRLTRERIRQIETKVILSFVKNYRKELHQIFLHMHAISGGKKILTFDDAKYFIAEKYAKIIWYFLPKINLDKEILFFDEDLNAIIFNGGTDSQNIDVTDFANYLPAEIVRRKFFLTR